MPIFLSKTPNLDGEREFNTLIDLDEMAAAGVRSVELIEGEPATDPQDGGMGQLGLEELFKAVMREIKDLAQEALGYDQICDPIQAVRRLAQEFVATKTQLANCHETMKKDGVRHAKALLALEESEAQLVEAQNLREDANAAFETMRKAGLMAGTRPVTLSNLTAKVIARAEKAEQQLASAQRQHEQFARDIARKLGIEYAPPVAKGDCQYLAAIESLIEQLAEAQSLRKDAKKLLGQIDDAVADLVKANGVNARLRDALVKVEAWTASEDGPIYHLWEDTDICNYDNRECNWEETLAEVRDFSIPADCLGYGTEWPVITLYREILDALEAPEAAREGEKNDTRPY